MVILITSIFLIIISIILIIVMYKNKDVKKNEMNYNLSTSSSPIYRNVCLIFYIIGCIFLIIAILLYFDKDNISMLIVFFFGLFLIVLSLLGLYTIYFTYEAIKDDKVIIRRILSMKEYQKSDIYVWIKTK